MDWNKNKVFKFREVPRFSDGHSEIKKMIQGHRVRTFHDEMVMGRYGQCLKRNMTSEKDVRIFE